MVECPAWLAYTKARIVSNGQNRRPVRLPNYDYRQAGAYFVTLCTQQRSVIKSLQLLVAAQLPRTCHL